MYPLRSHPFEEIINLNYRDELEDSPASPVRNIFKKLLSNKHLTETQQNIGANKNHLLFMSG